jgi:hypothetical protein
MFQESNNFGSLPETNSGGGSSYAAQTQQATFKGLDTEALTLTRTAARAEGMKLGPWISMHLREAAEKSLSLNNGVQVLHSESTDIQKIREMTENHEILIRKILSELSVVSSAQTVIMTKMLSQ